MDVVPFDPNVKILPANREERRRLVTAGTSLSAESFSKPEVIKKQKVNKRQQRKIQQLKRKVEVGTVREETIRELQDYRLPLEISDNLCATSLQTHRTQSTTLKRRRVNVLYNSSNTALSSSEDGSDNEESKNVSKESSSRSNVTVPAECLSNTDSISLEPINEKDFVVTSEKCIHSIDSNRRDDLSLLKKGIIISRPVCIEKQRSQLPAVSMEQEIVEAVMYNDIVLITGATGCGKSTQVPQFLYEAGFNGVSTSQRQLIGITQPRRVAVTSVCKRVGEELNNSTLCGYQIRYDSSIESECCLKFMTDGILLREVQNDFLCSQYKVIILDEAHERSINCDILIGLLSRSVALRRDRYNKGVDTLGPLRLIIMSATLRISDFTENKQLFPIPPPVLHIPARTHPVILHFARRTPDTNLIETITNKVVEIHRKLPSGSILVFVSGRREVHAVCSKIEQFIQYGTTHHENDKISEFKSSFYLNDDEEQELSDAEENLHKTDESIVDIEELPFISDCHPNQVSFNLEDEEENDNESNGLEKVYTEESDILSKKDIDEAASLGFDSGVSVGSINPKIELQDQRWLGCGVGSANNTGISRVRLVPLYALLPVKEQIKAFEPPASNERVIIVATNVAETSLTLPNIRYVVDSGKEKKRQFISSLSDSSSVFTVKWISKASADQRAGRAGRVGPGHCYRLYSSAMYTDNFSEFPAVNLFQTPLDSVLLFMASLGIPNIDQFPFPTPPAKCAVQRAQDLLLVLGALQKPSIPKSIHSTLQKAPTITRMGRLMSQLPVSPRYAVALVAAAARAKKENSEELLAACCCIVAGWSVGNIIDISRFDISNTKSTTDTNKAKQAKRETIIWKTFTSDLDAIWWLVAEFILSTNRPYFCRTNLANERQLSEAASLYVQLLHESQIKFGRTINSSYFATSPPSRTPQLSGALHDCFLLGLADNIAIRCDLLPTISRATTSRSGYIWSGTKSAKDPVALTKDSFIYIHNSSRVHDLRPRPALVGFSYILATLPNANNGVAPKQFLRECFPIDPVVLSSLPSPLVSHSEILSVPSPTYISGEDQVVGFVKSIYTPLDFALPSTKKPIDKKEPLRYRVFARALLEGQVFKFLKVFHNGQISYFRSHPSWLIGTSEKESRIKVLSSTISPNLTPDLCEFVKSLEQRQCGSRRELEEIWKADPKYLLSEFRALLCPTCPQSLITSLESNWGSTLHKERHK